MKSAGKLAFLLLLLPLVSGCPLLRLLGFPVGDKVPYNPKDTRGDIVVKRDIQFADIPTPLGFKLRRDETSSFRGQFLRFGRFKYEGAWTLRQTTAFYRQQMPVSGWEYVRTSEGTDVETQIYTKPRERCEVIIRSTLETIEVWITVDRQRAAKTSATAAD